MSSVRIGVVGCGYWGRNHVRTLAGLGALHAVSDADMEAAREQGNAHGVPAVSLDELLTDPLLDGVVLALPAQFHAPTALKVLGSGKHVFIEKPIALTASDAEEVVARAHERGRVVMAGHILRYHNAFRRVLEIVDSGRVGPVRHVQSHRLAFGKFHARFDAVWDLAPHDLSLVLSVTGEGPTHVQSIAVSPSGSGQADAAHIHMRFANDVTAHVHVSRVSPYMERRFAVIGEKGAVLWDDGADWDRKVSVVDQRAGFDGSVWDFAKGEAEFLPCEANMALTDELAHFMECIAAGTQPLTSGRQGADVVKILEQASENSSPHVTRGMQE